MPPAAQKQQKNLADAGRYNPRISPLPERTPKPLEEWGIDNGETIISHTFSAFSDPMYPPDFTHFDYVNPDAPKGGTLRLSAIGTFDSFNRYGQRGDTASFTGAPYLYDTLMFEAHDEIDALYPLIAEKIEYAKDFSYAIFHIDPRARFQDRQPITAEAVVFTFTKFMEQGVPQFAKYYADVSDVRATSERKVRFDLAKPSRAMIDDLAELAILPPQYWKDRDLAEPVQEITSVPMSSGSWKIADYEMGSWLRLEKIDDYWAADLPVQKGLHNFQYYRVDYYQDETVNLEAFKAGKHDYRDERISKNWATQYSSPLFENGVIIKAPFPVPKPPGSSAGFIFNTERELFADYRVRKAISYALDFEWMNKNLFYDSYTRIRSYFPNTDYEAKGLPSKEELEILEPIRESIPPEVFSVEYQPPKTDGSGSIREGIATALELFEEAGWELEEGTLKNRETGETFAFEIMIYSPSEERFVLPVQENLKKMGITVNIKMPDTTQYLERMRDGEYDMFIFGYRSGLYPSKDMEILWRSNLIDSTYNIARVQDPAIDYLVDGITANQQDKEALLHWGRAFDRVFQHQNYMIFNWTVSEFRIAHIDKFGKPEVWPKYGTTAWKYWWLDEDKLAALPENMR